MRRSARCTGSGQLRVEPGHQGSSALPLLLVAGGASTPPGHGGVISEQGTGSTNAHRRPCHELVQGDIVLKLGRTF